MSSVHRVVVIGRGSAGTRHHRTAEKAFPNLEFFWVSSREFESSREKMKELRHPSKNNKRIGAIIASPATLHLSQAAFFLDKGSPVMIEKPLTSEYEELDFFLDRFGQALHLIQVAYPLRQSKGFALVHQIVESGELGKVVGVEAVCLSFLPDWRKIDFRHSVSSQASLGGGVLNELSHELDYLQALFGDISFFDGRLLRHKESGLDVEDTAEISLVSGNEARINLNLSFWSTREERSCTMEMEYGKVHWSLADGTVTVATDKGITQCHDVSETQDEMFESQVRKFVGSLDKTDKSSANVKAFADATMVVRVIRDARSQGVITV